MFFLNPHNTSHFQLSYEGELAGKYPAVRTAPFSGPPPAFGDQNTFLFMSRRIWLQKSQQPKKKKYKIRTLSLSKRPLHQPRNQLATNCSQQLIHPKYERPQSIECSILLIDLIQDKFNSQSSIITLNLYEFIKQGFLKCEVTKNLTAQQYQHMRSQSINHPKNNPKIDHLIANLRSPKELLQLFDHLLQISFKDSAVRVYREFCQPQTPQLINYLVDSLLEVIANKYYKATGKKIVLKKLLDRLGNIIFSLSQLNVNQNFLAVTANSQTKNVFQRARGMINMRLKDLVEPAKKSAFNRFRLKTSLDQKTPQPIHIQPIVNVKIRQRAQNRRGRQKVKEKGTFIDLKKLYQSEIRTLY